MLNITDDQKELLLKYLPDAKQYIDRNDVSRLLEDLDDKITEIGFDADYELTDVGLKLQRLYDELYNQN